MPTRWLTVPLQKIFPPWLKPLVTPLPVGGRYFSTRPGAALPHVGSLFVPVAQHLVISSDNSSRSAAV